MANDILLFPSLTEDLKKKIRFQKTRFSFYYTDLEDNEYELVDEPVEAYSSVNIIRDEEGMWDQEKNNLGFRRKYLLRTFGPLFGEGGIVCHDAKLGMAIIWTSPDSKQRGVIPVGTFTVEDQMMEAVAEKLFGRAQLRGQVEFTTVIYLASAGNPSENEQHLANKSGLILGELESYIIKLDGSIALKELYQLIDKSYAMTKHRKKRRKEFRSQLPTT